MITAGESRWARFFRSAWRIGRWLALPLVAVAAVYLFRFSPVAVEVVAPARRVVIEEVLGTGTLEARVSTTISPKISGRIEEVLVDQGDHVRKDAPLVRLDDDELTQQVAIAEANVEAAEAALTRIKADKERAIAVFEQARRHHVRVKALRERAAATQEDMDRAAESLAVASADMARAEAAIREGQTGLIAAEKTRQYHRARLADTIIHAPFAGLMVARHREAGDIAVPGSAILTLIATDVVWISAWVDETQISKLKVDQSARVVFRSQPDRSYPGSVTRLGKQADRETREFIVDVQVKELPANWVVGQRAEVYIETARRENALSVPSSLVIRREEQTGVLVAHHGVARWRALSLGLRGVETVEVLDGLSESDVVIRTASGMSPLTDGRRVQVP